MRTAYSTALQCTGLALQCFGKLRSRRAWNGSSSLRRPAFVQDFLHRLERFFADVVFDAFAVDRGGLGADANGFQKRLNDFVAFPGGRGESFSLGREFDWLVGLRGHESITLQSSDGVVDGGVRDGEVIDQVN